MHYTNGAFAKQVGLNTIEVKGNPGRRIAHSSRKNTFSDLDLKGILKMYDCNDKDSGNIFIFLANRKKIKFIYNIYQGMYLFVLNLRMRLDDSY